MTAPFPPEDQSKWRLPPGSGSQLPNGSQDFLADDMARLNLDSDRNKGSVARFAEPNGSMKPSDPDSQVAHSRSPSGPGRLASQPAPDSDAGSQAQAADSSPSYPSVNNIQRSGKPPATGRPYRGAPTGFSGRNPQYRVPGQIQVGMPQQSLIPSPTGLGYPPGHAGPLSLGTPQQLFDMMSLPVDPNLSRVQPQNGIRANSQHSPSDPTNAHDIPSMNIQSFSPALFPPQMQAPLSMFPSQFYPNQDAYRAELAAQTQAMLAARLQQQYPSQFGPGAPGSGATDQSLVSPSSSNEPHAPGGPSANNRKLGLYKTELCRSWEEKRSCRYGTKCQFAHGEEELRAVQRHPKYKTEICRTFWVSGSCPYGKRCCFIHTELPNGAAPPNGNAPVSAATNSKNEAPTSTDSRPRSESNGSDPSDQHKSLLARISTARESTPASTSTTPTPIDTSSTKPFPFSSRPPTGSLRVDTKSLDGQAYKTQNKSAFPVFPNSRNVQAPQETVASKSPIPVTAGPDFGRHTASRLEIVGQNSNGTTTPTNGHSYSTSADEGSGPNHQRASSGAWAQTGRAPSNYTTASPVTENITSPWTTQELVTGGSRQRPW